MAPSNPPTSIVNVVVLATIVGVVALVANTVFLPILWSEIANEWNEFDEEMRNIKDLCDNLWGDIGKLRVKPTRERRESVRRNLELSNVELQASQRDEDYTSEQEGGQQEEQEQTEDYDNEVRRAPIRSLAMVDDAEDISIMPRCECKLGTCPKGPPGPKGTSGLTGLSGEPGPDGIPGKDATEIVASPRDPTRCIHCPAGPVGPPGLSGSMGMRGMRGAEGRPGCFGRNGEPGVPGAMGDSGPVGDPGPLGPPGAIGQPARIVMGSMGLKGPTGPPGVVGVVGDKGETGRFGMPGQTGPHGPPGKVGTPGKDGEVGFIGLPGRRGQEGEHCLCPSAKSPSTAPQPPAPMQKTKETLVPFKNSGAFPVPKPMQSNFGRNPPGGEPQSSSYDQPTTPIGLDPSGYEVDDKMIEHVANLIEEHDNAVMEMRRENPVKSRVEVTPAMMPTSPPAFVPPHHKPESISKDGYEIYTGLREQQQKASKEIAGEEDKLTLSTVKPTIGMFRTIGPKSAVNQLTQEQSNRPVEATEEDGAIPKSVFRKSFRKIHKSNKTHQRRTTLPSIPETTPNAVFVPIRFPKNVLNRAFNGKTAFMKQTPMTNDDIPADIFSVHS